MEKVIEQLSKILNGSGIFELSNIEKEKGLSAKIFAVFEGQHPFEDVSSSAAFYALLKAEREGALAPHGTLIIATVDDAVNAAIIAARKEYYCIAVLPEGHPQADVNILEALGAQIYFSPAHLGSAGVALTAENLAKDIPNSFILSHDALLFQDEPANHSPDMIMDACKELPDIDVFVPGGLDELRINEAISYLKGNLQEPKIYSTGHSFDVAASENVDTAADISASNTASVRFDGDVIYNTEDAFFAARLMAKKEGIITGVEAAAPLYAALTLAKKPEFDESSFLIYLADDESKFYDSPLFIKGK